MHLARLALLCIQLAFAAQAAPIIARGDSQANDLAARDPGTWCDPNDCNPLAHPEKRDEQAVGALEVPPAVQDVPAAAPIEASSDNLEKRDPGNWCDPNDCNPLAHPEKRDVPTAASR
ncbi:hypothetical protein HDU81_000429 [Chytriomyces hyalinus]|nr:hypothetical protein HDU81_000429 [Chytriomyces hyalinus]